MQRHDFMYLVENPLLWQTPMVVSIGVFDGFHKGHRSIIEMNRDLARTNGWQSMVITFDRNPKMVFATLPFHKQLSTEDQFAEYLASIGVDHLVVIDFSAEFSKLTAEEFLSLICTLCTVKAMVVGADFRCGEAASSAGPVQLQEYLARLSPGARMIVPPFVQTEAGETVSSTLVRKKLLEGALEDVQSMLGRPYELDVEDILSTPHEDGLLYHSRSVMQLLPPDGWYGAYLVLSSGERVEGDVHLDEQTLRFTPGEHRACDEKMVGIQRLGLTAKRSVS
jgi:riboflavin kinase/FMN adenylyltransferase